jgi:hypothetical protein
VVVVRVPLVLSCAVAFEDSCLESIIKSTSDPELLNDASSMEKPSVDSFSDPTHVVGVMKPARALPEFGVPTIESLSA